MFYGESNIGYIVLTNGFTEKSVAANPTRLLIFFHFLAIDLSSIIHIHAMAEFMIKYTDINIVQTILTKPNV